MLENSPKSSKNATQIQEHAHESFNRGPELDWVAPQRKRRWAHSPEAALMEMPTDCAILCIGWVLGLTWAAKRRGCDGCRVETIPSFTPSLSSSLSSRAPLSSSFLTLDFVFYSVPLICTFRFFEAK
jgi:hypothetical protein